MSTNTDLRRVAGIDIGKEEIDICRPKIEDCKDLCNIEVTVSPNKCQILTTQSIFKEYGFPSDQTDTSATTKYIDSFKHGKNTKNIIHTVLEYFKFQLAKKQLKKTVYKLKLNVEKRRLAFATPNLEECITGKADRKIITERIDEMKSYFDIIRTHTKRALTSAMETKGNSEDCLKLTNFRNHSYDTSYESEMKSIVEYLKVFIVWNLSGISPLIDDETKSASKSLAADPKMILFKALQYSVEYSKPEKIRILEIMKALETSCISVNNCAKQNTKKYSNPVFKETSKECTNSNGSEVSLPGKIKVYKVSNKWLYDLLENNGDAMFNHFQTKTNVVLPNIEEKERFEERDEYTFKVEVPLSNEVCTESQTIPGHIACRYVFVRKSRQLLKILEDHGPEGIISNITNIISCYLEIYESNNSIIPLNELQDCTAVLDHRKIKYNPIYLPIKVYINFSNALRDCWKYLPATYI